MRFAKLHLIDFERLFDLGPAPVEPPEVPRDSRLHAAFAQIVSE